MGRPPAPPPADDLDHAVACLTCRTVWRAGASFTQHVANAHRARVPWLALAVSDSPCSCLGCRREWKSSHALGAHVRGAHCRPPHFPRARRAESARPRVVRSGWCCADCGDDAHAPSVAHPELCLRCASRQQEREVAA